MSPARNIPRLVNLNSGQQRAVNSKLKTVCGQVLVVWTKCGTIRPCVQTEISHENFKDKIEIEHILFNNYVFENT